MRLPRTTRVRLATEKGAPVEAVWSGAWWFAITIRPLKKPDPKTGKFPTGLDNILEKVDEPGARQLTRDEESRVLAGFGLSHILWERRLGEKFGSISRTPPLALEELAESK